jgi:hypothetical protein
MSTVLLIGPRGTIGVLGRSPRGEFAQVAQRVEHQIANLVLFTQRGQESDQSPDTWSGNSGPKLRPVCDQATRDAQGQMSDSHR